MMPPSHPKKIAALAAMIALSASLGTARSSAQSSPTGAITAQSQSAAIAQARLDSARHPYTTADIQFMSGMISHHAQAVLMASWAPSHGANASVQRLAERIINAQTDEIKMMQTWLRDRLQPVPEPDPKGMTMVMDGIQHKMLMPGMLSDAQMKQLDQARGADFDQFFLTFMIQHHRGAVAMVKDLFASYGAGQDETVFKFASDANVDQTTEIARMQKMLASVIFGVQAP